ncbi:GtrA family protein [Actinosynnema pretiosum]|uniref:GtrA family protein n=1 Tax=Actinosynnema pretiosum TaxID=42197 RepID=UPI001E40A77A|nr:GtrA family protein [Actinosynnema pretiosum]
MAVDDQAGSDPAEQALAPEPVISPVPAPVPAPAPSGGLGQLIRFGLVGGVNTLIDLVLYMVLTGVGLPFLVANFASTSAGMGFSFVANKYFTFGGGGGGAAKQGALFFAFTAFGLWVIHPVVIFGVEALMAVLDQPLTGLAAWLPKLAAICAGLVWNYTAYSRVVFRRR